MSFNWSEEKEKLFRFESDTLVSASAGTGKTTALVELYMRLLEGRTSLDEKIPPENILAMTFTKKATREMRERILESVSERKLDIDPQTIYLNSNIYTFHGFCQNVLREYSYDAGLSDEFGIIDEIEKEKIQNRTIYRYLVREITAGNNKVKQFFNSFSFAEFQSCIKNILGKLSGNMPKVYDEKEMETFLYIKIRESIQSYDYVVKQWSQYLEENKKKRTGKFWDRMGALLDFWPSYYKSYFKDNNLTVTEASFETVFEFANGWTEFEKQYKIPKVKECTELQEEMKSIVVSMPLLLTQIKTIPETIDFTEIICEIQKEFEAAKQQSDLLDYDDLEQQSIALLESNDEIREEIQKRFQVILVDEFQDTNETQVILLNLIKRSNDLISRGFAKTRNLFVGDRKQSIYKFRGAEVEVFRNIENRMTVNEQEGTTIHFKENYRSIPELLSVFNKLSTSIMSSDTDNSYEVNYTADDDLVDGKQDEVNRKLFPVDLVLLNTTLNADEGAKKEADYIARLIKSYCSNDEFKIKNRKGEYVTPEYSDIAVLLRTRSKQQIFEQAFRQHNIPVTIGEGNGLFDRQEIRDIENLLIFFYQPFDKTARYAVLRSPAVLLTDESLVALSLLDEDHWCHENLNREHWEPLLAGISEEDRDRFLQFVDVYHDLVKRKNYLTASEVAEEFLYSLNVRVIESGNPDFERKIANIEKFLDVIRKWEKSNPSFNIADIKERLKMVRDRNSLRESEAEFVSSISSVSLMTIHASKGLEFPVVILPQLHAPAGGDRDESKMKLGDNREILKKYFNEETQKWETTYSFEKKKELDKAKELSESLRLFYVAITRARNHLVLSGSVTANKNKKVNHEGSDSKKWMDWVAAHFALANKNNLYEEYEKVLVPAYLNSDILHFSHFSPVLKMDDSKDTEWAQKYLEYFDIDSDININNQTDSGVDLPSDQTEKFDLTYLLNRFEELQQKRFEPELIGTFSVSSLRDLSICQRKYQLKHLLDKSTLLWMENSEEISGIADVAENETTQGILVHKYFELLEPSQKASLDSWHKFLANYELDKNADWAKAAGKRIERAGAYPETVRENPISFLKELPFIARIKLPSGSVIRVKGVIDALRYYTDHGFEIIDYKYAKYQEHKHKGYVFQIQLYAEVIRQAFGYQSEYEKAYLGYLKEDQVYREVKLDDKTRNEFIEELDRMIKQASELDSMKEVNWSDKKFLNCKRTDCRFIGICNK